MLTLVKKLMMKILNLTLLILLEDRNIKNIFAKGNVPNWSEAVFMIKKVKKVIITDNICPQHSDVDIFY